MPDALHQVVLADVAGIEDRLCAQQAHLAQHQLPAVAGGVPVKAAGRLALGEVGGQLLQPGGLGGGRLVVAALGGLGHPAGAVLHHFQVGQDQLVVDDVDVRQGVDRLGFGDVLHHMDDVVVVKAAHHMDDGVALPDVPQELVAQARALGRALDQARDVHELDDGGGLFVGLPDLGQLVQPGVGHRHDAAVGLDGAEGVVGRLGVAGRGDGVEKGGLAHVGQADDT